MPQSYIPYLAMAAVLILVIRRNLRAQRIRAGTLWVMPLLLALIAALSVSQSPPRDAAGAAILAIAALAGAVAGWHRGKLIHITLDAETGVLTGKGSVIGLALILGLYVARYAVVAWAQSHPDHTGAAVIVADGALLFGFATLIVARLEMWLRCRRLMAERAPAG
jgi:hypothetical protein